MSEHKTLVEVQHLQQYFPAGGVGKNRKYVQAVDDVSFAIRKGETLGLVGESGCGKTTTGRTLLRLYEPTGGKIYYDGNLLFDKEKNIAVDMLPYRRRMQIVFQDPYASLDPRMTIGDIVGEGIDIHHLAENDKDRHDKIIALLERVGLNSEHANRYCHEFSGGQRQRVGIARALAVNPEFIVCDEPVSALDVSIQAQVVNMFEDLQQEMGLTYLFIAHDLSVVKHISNRIGVMYLGKLVELADSYDRPQHPPLHPQPDLCHPGGRPHHGTPVQAYRAAGRCAQPPEPAVRLPLPHPLPLRRRAVRRRGAGVQGGHLRPLGSLPSSGQGEVKTLHSPER